MLHDLNAMHDREDGFTLVELLIVVLIIGILAAIAIPIYLGIQGNSHKAAVRADVNIAVKKVQVNLTEGSTVAAQYGITNGSEKGETIEVKASTNTKAAASDFMVTGNESTANTPKGAIDYTYQYDSVTGKFSDSDNGDIALGGASVSKVTITTSALTDANTTDTYNQVISVNNLNPSGSNVFNITGLPTGLTYSTSTGTITGTPNATGTATVAVTVTNGTATDSRSYTLNIGSKPVITTSSLPNGVKGTAYSKTLTASGTPGSFTYAVASGTLPTGLTLNTTTGEIAGTPTANGPYTFGVTATNTAGTGAATSFTVTVGQAPVITTTSLPADNPFASYSTTVAATGYPSPNLSLTNTVNGFALANDGTLTGTLPATGSTTIPVTATNSFGTTTGSLTVTPRTNLLTDPSFEAFTADTDLPIYTSQTNTWAHGPSSGSDAIARTWNTNSGTHNDAQGNNILPKFGNSMLGYFPGSKSSTSVIQDITTTVTSGNTYTMGMWYRDADATHSQAVTLQAYVLASANNANCGLGAQNLTATNTWQYVSFTTTSSCSGPLIRFQIVPTAGTYFDGRFNTVYDGTSVTKSN